MRTSVFAFIAVSTVPISFAAQNKPEVGPFAEIDKHALAAPESVEKSIPELAKYLVQPCKTDKEKVRAFFRWITDKVSYDTKRYRIEWVGHFEDEQRAEARFGLILGLILGLMIVLLYAEFGLLRQVVLILGVVPLATLGGLIALHATGVTLNVASGVGFIALFGVAVMNGVIMVANLNRVRDLGIPLMEAVVTGASERLRPVLMTATVATVGMLPAAMATGVGSDVQRSLATVVAGGLLVATLMTLFLLPTMYFVIETLAARFAAAGAREAPQLSA